MKLSMYDVIEYVKLNCYIFLNRFHIGVLWLIL
jgi:hypothetical protein